MFRIPSLLTGNISWLFSVLLLEFPTGTSRKNVRKPRGTTLHSVSFISDFMGPSYCETNTGGIIFVHLRSNFNTREISSREVN